ncbi:MAG: PilZ domain-containing protein [Proteobacteria bacterium]|nr:PilZ domain-containing protein [Pseudomonadota bacterium]MBU1058385.1 PilZ domain-containing protein [Pseudomonadota bacterium]
MVPQFADRRQCTRTHFMTMALIRVELEDLEVQADLQDISITGMYVGLEKSLSPGTICSIQIFIKGKHSDLILDDIEGEVVREGEGGMAIRFTSNMEWFVLFTIYSQYARNRLHA